MINKLFLILLLFFTHMFRVRTMSNQVGSITQRPMSTILPNNEDHGSNMIVLHWFRQGDLRLHDNPALVHSCKLAAAHKGGVVVPCFVFDSAIYGAEAITSNRTGSLKCGPRRAQFVTECVADLRQNLKEKCGSQLLIAHGDPAEIMDQWIQKLMQTTHNDNSITKNKCSISIVCQEEVVAEERRAVKAVQAVLKKYMPKNWKVQTIWGSTMYDIHDLPFDKELIDMPDVFTPFRNKVEKKSVIQKPFAAPHHGKIPFFANNSFAFDAVVEHMACMPTLQDLGYTSEQIEYAATVDSRGVMEFRGGESAALARMKDYIWDKDCLKDYFDTRNGMIGADYSTKFSPWLAHGCLSPRRVASECKRYEQERVENKSTYWVVFELLWRDFCKFFALKHGDAIFFPSGTVGVPRKWSHFEKNFEAWKLGLTGYPLVDANMREMLATGFMSNRGRQNVASFLTIDLAHDWRMGGDWFETNLLDYDVYSNWVVRVSVLRDSRNVSCIHVRRFCCLNF